MPALRPMVVELPWDANRRSSPASLDEDSFLNVEGLLDRWISLSILGGLVIGSGWLVLLLYTHTIGTSIPGPWFVSIGILEMFFGLFLAYVVYPPALWAVGVGSALTVVLGAILALEGNALAGLLGTLCLAAGAVLTAVGLLYAIRAWEFVHRSV